MSGCYLHVDAAGRVTGAHHNHPPTYACRLDPLVATSGPVEPPAGPVAPPDGPPVDPAGGVVPTAAPNIPRPRPAS